MFVVSFVFLSNVVKVTYSSDLTPHFYSWALLEKLCMIQSSKYRKYNC